MLNMREMSLFISVSCNYSPFSQGVPQNDTPIWSFYPHPSVQISVDLSAVCFGQLPVIFPEVISDILRTVTPGDVFVETVFSGVGKVVYGSYRICPVIIIYVIVPEISPH